MYQFFAEQYGWPPETVDRLTLYQAAIFMGAICPDHGTVKMTRKDHARYYGNRQARKAVTP